MRFEVKGGGIIAILFALTILSGAVFVLGLLAGYDVGRQAQLDTAQLATSYPLQSPPSSSAASNETQTEPATSSVQSAASITPSVAAGGGTPVAVASVVGNRDTMGSMGPTHRPSQAGATSAGQRLASTSPPSAAEPASSAAGSAEVEENIGAGSGNAEAHASSEASTNAGVPGRRNAPTTALSMRHKPYNIQIQAAMDISGADQMMARLKKLGYPSHLIPTEIAGQRWYKVEVGPYATPEEASQAEIELREQYDSTYGGVARGNSAGHTSANDNSEE